MTLLSDSDLNVIRGKSLVGRATISDVLSVFAHLDAIEQKLDELDEEDTFGTEGWRSYFGVPE